MAQPLEDWPQCHLKKCSVESIVYPMISWDFSGLPVLLNDSLHDVDPENDNPVICYERSLRPVAKAIEAAGLHGIGYCFACGDTISY